MYEMKPEYYTGIVNIDNEHTRLFELAQETYELLGDNLLHDKTERLTALISELIDYTKKHFAHEEAYMESIHYAHIPAHITLHRKFVDSLMAFDPDSMGEDSEAPDKAVEELLNFLVGWLINHIQKVDMLYAKPTSPQ